MNLDETPERADIRQRFERMLDAVDERTVSWDSERKLLEKMSDMRDNSVNEIYNFDKTLEQQIAGAYELLGIAQGIEYALCILGLSRRAYEKDIKIAKEEIDKRAEERSKVERDYKHTLLNKCSKLKTQYFTAYSGLEEISKNEFDSPAGASHYILETLDAPEAD
jgi:hypothetical protein